MSLKKPAQVFVNLNVNVLGKWSGWLPVLYKWEEPKGSCLQQGKNSELQKCLQADWEGLLAFSNSRMPLCLPPQTPDPSLR